MTEAIETPRPALILFGQDAAGRPRAAWFDNDELPDAERASGAMGYIAWRVTSEEERAFAERLPRGRIGVKGKPQVRALSHKLFEALRQLASANAASTEGATENGSVTDAASAANDTSSRSESVPPANQPTTNGAALKPLSTALVVVEGGRANPSPQDWNEITNGSLVLAYDPRSLGWYEAVVINTLNDTFRLTWRDYPEEGVITRRRDQLALLPRAA